MPGFASQQIQLFSNTWVAGTLGARSGGIVTSGFSGYHCGRAYISDDDDYSIQLAEDRQGDPGASCAVDVILTMDQMKKQMTRLHESWRDQSDLRLNGARNFVGTLNGTRVQGFDCYSGAETFGWDNSHLTHIHFEVLRVHFANWTIMQNFLSVILGATMVDVNTLAILAGMRMLLGNWAPSREEWIAAKGDAAAYDALSVKVKNGLIPDNRANKERLVAIETAALEIKRMVGDQHPIIISDAQLDTLASKLSDRVVDRIVERLRE